MGTNIELVAFAKKALAENWGYCLGSFGNILTPSFLAQKLSQGGGVGVYNARHKDYLNKFLNKRVSDCYGLVKGFHWWNGGNVKYVATQDRNQEGAYTAAKEKGPLSTMPEIPGLVLWMKGHAGIYIGNGEFIECAGAPRGMFKGKIVGGKVTMGSKFTHWFKDTYITYTGTPTAIRQGDKGTEVTSLQTSLNKLGYNLVVDSSFGPATDKAVKDFQSKNGLKVDGAVGKETLTTLEEMLLRISNGRISIDLLGEKLTLLGVHKNNTHYMKVGNAEISVRSIFESMGLKVTWDERSQTILVKK